LVDLQRMIYPHKWSPISYRSSVGQRKHAGQRPKFYHWTTQPTNVSTGMGDRLQPDKPPRYFTKPPRPTHPLTLMGRETSAGQSAAMLCGWGVTAGWLIAHVDKRVSGSKTV